MKKSLLISILSALILTATRAQSPDSIAPRFERQLQIFPQEKIYLHTDKSYYLSGETIWFRAHVADAATHKPANASRYVYVELIDPLDSVRVRLKVRPDSTGAHSGSLLIPSDLPEGNYEMRAYTHFMLNLPEEYFFRKSVNIISPQARYIQTNCNFEFASDSKVDADIYLQMFDNEYIIKPEKAKLFVGARTFEIRPKADGKMSVSFRFFPDDKRAILLETVQDNYAYRQFIDVVNTKSNDFDLSFYPEGGSMLVGVNNRVAFKALMLDGRSANIKGKIYDNENTELSEFKTDRNGMGCLSLACEAGKTYYVMAAIGDNEAKRFDLPEAKTSGCMLRTDWHGDKLFVSVNKTLDIQTKLYLVTHTRGVVHFTTEWEQNRQSLALSKEIFPSGVLQLVLLDEKLQPLSERLVFINNNDQVQTEFSSNKQDYKFRSLAENTIVLMSPDSLPLIGNFSLSVTEDKEVETDSTTNILTNLLLSSDLRGRIENPESYFQHNPKSEWLLDLLMMTQGWRRYDVPTIIVEQYTKPSVYLEVGPSITGKVVTYVGKKPEKDKIVTAWGMNNNYQGTAISDDNGHFELTNCELPDSSRLMISTVNENGKKNQRKRIELLVDNVSFPLISILPIPKVKQNSIIIPEYAQKAEEKYTEEGGVRIIYIKEVIISASKPDIIKSPYIGQPSVRITQSEINKIPLIDMASIYRRIPGVMVQSGGYPVILHGQNMVSLNQMIIPAVFYNDMPIPWNPIVDPNAELVKVFLQSLNPSNIAQIDVYKGVDAMKYPGGGTTGHGVMVIYSKRGDVLPNLPSPNIKLFRPLGYHRPAAFYSPKYDTHEARDNPKPDLRTTIYWNPSITTDSSGHASFSFYTADTESSYTVTIEGLAEDGRIIHKVGKINVVKK